MTVRVRLLVGVHAICEACTLPQQSDPLRRSQRYVIESTASVGFKPRSYRCCGAHLETMVLMLERAAP